MNEMIYRMELAFLLGYLNGSENGCAAHEIEYLKQRIEKVLNAKPS